MLEGDILVFWIATVDRLCREVHMEFHCSHTTNTISICVSSREEKLRYVTMVAKVLDLNEPWSCKYGRKKKNENIDMYGFAPVHDCTQAQNGSPCFSSIVQRCK